MNANSSDWNNMNAKSSNINQEWSAYENKLFETTLTQLDLNSPNLYENIMIVLPWKSLEQIKIHFAKLITDIIMLEMDEISPPNYDDNDDGIRVVNNKVDRRKGVPWTEEEHRRFLIGLAKLGKGEWKNISKYFIPNKTAAQVASHAQKYFRRVNKCTTPLDKRRYSIHDIRLFNSDIVETSARNPGRHSLITRVPGLHLHLPSANANNNINIETDTNTNTNNNAYITPQVVMHENNNVMKGPQQQQIYPSFGEANNNNITAATFNNNNFGPTSANNMMTMGSDFNYMGGLNEHNYMGSFDKLPNYDQYPINYDKVPNNTDQYPTNNYGELPNYDQFPTNYELPNYQLPTNYGELPTNYDQLPANYGELPTNFYQNPTNYGELPNYDQYSTNYGELFTSSYWVPQSSDHHLAPLP